MLKVVIADDHAILREGLRGILTATEDMEVIAAVLKRMHIECDVEGEVCRISKSRPQA